MRLRHIHLPSSPPAFPSYRLAVSLQEHLRRQLLDAKYSSGRDPTTRPPAPTLVSFTPQPTYTLGRRQTAPLTPAETARLRAPLLVRFAPDDGGGSSSPHHHTYRPEVLPSPRGGLATYHGPGQVVLWAVTDLHPPGGSGRPALSVRAYSRLLENTTSTVLARLFGLATTTATANPGVWVVGPRRCVAPAPAAEAPMRKVAALGVHLRRHVTALGVAVNLDMPTTTADMVTAGEGDAVDKDAESVCPWARIVACGLEDRGVTSVAREVGRGVLGRGAERRVAAAWAAELASGLGLDGVEAVGEAEVAELLGRVGRVGGSEGEGV